MVDAEVIEFVPQEPERYLDLSEVFRHIWCRTRSTNKTKILGSEIIVEEAKKPKSAQLGQKSAEAAKQETLNLMQRAGHKIK